MRAGHLLHRNLLAQRRTFGVVVSGFVEPVFYLFAVGIGIGALVGEVAGPDGRPVAYAAFVAPALLAASAMNGAAFESTFNVFFKLRFARTYDAVLATPMEPRDIAVGEAATALLRGALYAVGFLVVATVLGLARSWWTVLALPAALLIGFAFAALGMAASTFMRSWQDLDLVTLATLPLFLFSATFYPLEAVPPLVQRLTLLSPLYHGTVLVRGLMLGAPSWSMLGNAVLLLVLGVAGTWVAGRRFAALLRR